MSEATDATSVPKEGAKKRRNSSLELLRIISMLLIVGHHYAIYGYPNIGETIGVGRFVLEFFTIGGKLGVILFILISGYFMCKSRFTWGKLFRVVLQSFGYSVLLYLLPALIAPEAHILTPHHILENFLPLASGAYWFVTCYVLLMLLSPLLNLALERLPKESLRRFLICFVLLWFVAPVVLNGRDFEAENLGSFVIIYAIGAYIRLYQPFKNLSAKVCFAYFAGSFALLYVAIVGSLLLFAKTGEQNFYDLHYRLRYLNSFMLLGAAVLLFAAFERLKPFYNKAINAIASTAFGVYLIHDNNLMRPLIWRRFLRLGSLQSSPMLIPYSILCILAVFYVCSLIDYVFEPLREEVYKFVDRKTKGFLSKPVF